MKRFFLSFLLSVFILPISRIFAEEIILDITEDSYIDSIQFYDFQGNSGRFLLGFGDTTGNGITQVFLKYSADNFFEKGIAPDKIEKVVLNLYQYRNKHGTDYDVVVSEPSSDWHEAVLSWNNQPLVQTVYPQSQKISSSLAWKEIDITELVVKQLWDFDNSFGIAISAADPYLSGGSFWSTNCKDPLTVPMCLTPLFPYITVSLKEDAKLELKSPSPAEKFMANKVKTKWQFNKDDELYKVELSDDSNFTDILKTSNWISEKNIDFGELSNRKYYWRVKTYFSKLISEIRSFEIEVKEDVQKEEKPKEIVKNEEILPEVKGVSTNKQKQLGYCKYRYNSSNREITIIRCKLEQPTIPRIDHLLSKDGVYWLDTEVQIPQYFDVFIEYTQCKPKTLWDPSTWFGCSEKILETTQETAEIRGSIWAANQGKRIDTYKKKIAAGKYKISFPLSEDMSAKKFSIKYDTRYAKQLNGSTWLDIFELSPKSNSVTIPKVKVSGSDLYPYRFPFEKAIGVTQWYGDTDYQHPHTGIDFGAKMEKVFAPADGRIIYAGWDNGKNKCLSGGNYVLIEHKGGKHTIFLHLKDFNNDEGKAWKKGDKIDKGQKIGTTGNSGLYNCESLGYHLHFETRTSKSSSSHTNPVPLTNIDWNKIPTLGYSSYPGRLSGQNPHPGK